MKRFVVIIAILIAAQSDAFAVENCGKTPPLVRAAEATDRLEFDKWVARTRNPDAADGCGRTALMTVSLGYRAIDYDYRERSLHYVSALLAKGANPNAKDKNGFTPLYYAVKHYRANLVEALVSAGGEINGYYKLDGSLLLTEKTLLSLACDIDSGLAREWSGNESRVEIIRALLKAGARPNDVDRFVYPTGERGFTDGVSPLMYAVRHPNSVEAVNLLLDSGADVNLQDNYPAARFTALTSLLWGNRGQNLSAGEKEIVEANLRAILKKGARPNIPTASKETVLQYAAAHLSPGFMGDLLMYGPDVNFANQDAVSPLMLASKNSNAAAIGSKLIAAGADINFVGFTSVNALGYAVLHSEYGRADSIADFMRVMIGAGINLKGTVALGIRAPAKILTVLLSAHSDVNERDRNGSTPLINLVRTDDSELAAKAALLIQAGASIDAQDASGYTALMRVVEEWQTNRLYVDQLLDQILAAKPNFDLKNSAGKTALELARFPALKQKLMNAGAR